MHRYFRQTAVALLATAACTPASDGAADSASATAQPSAATAPTTSVPADSGERHLTQIRQLTFGGENAEAYFNSDGTQLTFQSTRDGRRPVVPMHEARWLRSIERQGLLGEFAGTSAKRSRCVCPLSSTSSALRSCGSSFRPRRRMVESPNARRATSLPS